jgi:dihydroflavonol-4-reductase
MKNILVTGGTGFIGSNLALKLLEENYNVQILRRRDSDLRALEGIDVEHRIGDVLDKESVIRAMKGCDTVFHTAAVVSFWKKEVQKIHDVNVLGTRNATEAALEVGIERFVHTSSVAAIGYRTDGRASDETTEFNWGSLNIPYKNSKMQAELEVLKAVERGLPAVIVNPTVVVGERDIHFHGGRLIRELKRGLTLFYVDTWMNIVYVGDVVLGHLLAAAKGEVGERYLLGGENLTAKEVFERAAKVVGGRAPRIRVPMFAAKLVARAAESLATLRDVPPIITPQIIVSAQYSNPYSSEKAIRELGYRITPVEVAIQKAYEWYVEKGMI